MQKTRYFPMTLIAAAVAIFSGCSSIPQNSPLTEAHSSYNSARSDPQVMNFAAVELLQAGESLGKADHALSKGVNEGKVDQLAYMAKLQVGIAQETAERKSHELAVTNASSKRDQDLLHAKTAEADAAKQELAVVAETVDQQAAALAIASANAERDQALIAQQEIQLKELNAKKTERGLVITLGDVLFSSNKAQLESGGIHNVQKLADFLKQYPLYKVLVEGYTDSTGSNNLNQELSDRRANAVRTALLDMGSRSDHVTARGYGEAYPVAGNDTAASRQLNRRVEIILSDGNGNIAPR
ncbi:MAG: OmpA family protein [Gammaproteobacteria bacterium]|nr:OmpA family protein [Gammaproteobacteria bacterium]MBU1979469.1 OmpA family protein [Gammaproteobacteria bacterium]